MTKFKQFEWHQECNFPFRKPSGMIMGMRLYDSNAPTEIVRCTIEPYVHSNKQTPAESYKVVFVPIDENDLLVYGKEIQYASDACSQFEKCN